MIVYKGLIVVVVVVVVVGITWTHIIESDP